VQSINGGRVSPPEGGNLPQLGQTVRRGDALALVEAPIIAADRATLAERVGEIEQQTALAEARLARARRLLATGSRHHGRGLRRGVGGRGPEAPP
jgi:multidrug efflux pump subunit AcrA (membrane-fusion protein)